jgi:hypothetical protein
MSNEGSLFVVVIAPIEGDEEKSDTGLKVALGEDGPVLIGHLTNNFITSKCVTFAEKPKVFIFIDSEVATNSMVKGVPVRTHFYFDCRFFFLLIIVLFICINSFWKDRWSICNSTSIQITFLILKHLIEHNIKHNLFKSYSIPT